MTEGRATQFDIDPNQAWRTVSSASCLEPCDRRENAAVTIVGIDGHSGSGKTALAAALAATSPHATVVHTDDIAWHHSFFDWNQLLVDHVLEPLRRAGPPVSYRPQPWIERDRAGAITVPADSTVVIVEGVGACRRELDSWFDMTLWVHADPKTALARTVSRGVDTLEFIEDWMAQENALLGQDQPWTRADLFVLGAPDPPTESGALVVATGPRLRGTRRPPST